MLKERELVQSLAYGVWRFADSADVASVSHADLSEDIEADPFEDFELPHDGSDSPIHVEQWVGDGAQLVYVYSYPAPQTLDDGPLTSAGPRSFACLSEG